MAPLDRLYVLQPEQTFIQFCLVTEETRYSSLQRGPRYASSIVGELACLSCTESGLTAAAWLRLLRFWSGRALPLHEIYNSWRVEVSAQKDPNDSLSRVLDSSVMHVCRSSGASVCVGPMVGTH